MAIKAINVHSQLINSNKRTRYTSTKLALTCDKREELEEELEVEWKAKALNLNAVRDAETKPVDPSVRRSRTHILLRNSHPLNQSLLVPKPHLKDPCPLNRAFPQGSRAPVQ